MKGFSKLPEEVQISLTADNIVELTMEQEALFTKIREGKNLLVKQLHQTGISSILAWVALYKVPTPEEGSPRAIIICSSDDKAIAMYEDLKKHAKRMDLTLDLANDKGNQLKQRNDLFDGTEIIIGTTKRIYDLYIQNGINLNLLRYFVIDDAETVFMANRPGFLLRIADSLPKCQVILNCHEITPKINHFVTEIPIPFEKVVIGS